MLQINSPIFSATAPFYSPTEIHTAQFKDVHPLYSDIVKLYKHNAKPKYKLSRRNHIKNDISELTISPLRPFSGKSRT